MADDNKMRRTLTDRAEGKPEHLDRREPAAVQRTSTSPTVRTITAAGVTGRLSMDVRMQAEGVEDPDNREGVRLASSEEKTQPARPDAKPVPEPKPVETATMPKSKPHILIVEDTEELAEVIQATLENRGMQVTWVSHGSKGVERVKANSPDVLLLDIGLPDMTGWKLLEELHEWKKDPNELPKVIVITAYGDPANRLIGKLQGIHSYLIKPFTSDEVEKVVQKALSQTV